MEESLFYGKAFTALCFDSQKLRNFQEMSEQCNVDAYGMIISIPLESYAYVISYNIEGMRPWDCYIFIGVGVALLVQHFRAMRRPLTVERVTVLTSTLFAFYSLREFYY